MCFAFILVIWCESCIPIGGQGIRLLKIQVMSRPEKGSVGNKSVVHLLLGAPGDSVRSEREQAVLRLVILGLTILYLMGIRQPGEGQDDPGSELFGYVIGITFVAAGIYLSTYLWPVASVSRKVFGVFVDCIGFSVALYLAEDAGAPWFGIYLWVIFGNTLRYGSRYLYLSSIFSLIGFGWVLLFSEYWHAHLGMGIGLWITLLVLPGYAAALAQRLRNAQIAAENANRAKGQFLANMSHEIRTPLNGIIGAAELLKERDLPREDRHLVNIINRSGGVLLELINNVLDLSKIEANKLVSEAEPFDLHQFMNTVVDMMSIEAQKKGLRLLRSIDPRLPCRLEGDENHLKQVLVNLVGNAIKFTPEGEVELRCMLVDSEESGVRVQFSVRDTGIGIPPEKQAKILEPFVQADSSTSRQFGGTGLGTTIARELVELMGGELSLESVPGRGTTFRFTLPMAVVEEEPGSVQLPIAGRSVLALFERAEVAREYCRHMQEWSLEVLAANDTASAERLLRQAFYDYSPVEAIVVGSESAAAVAPSLVRWQREGLVAENVPLVVVAAESGQPPFGERVVDRKMWVESEMELFHALHTVGLPQELEEDIFNEARELATPLNILIADDNATNRLILASMLRNAGHRVTETGNGEEFLEAIESDDYDLAMLDMHMPDMNGLEAYQLYRFAHAGEEIIPFIMITADVTEAARAACEEAGIERILPKPISAVQLFQAIEELGIGATHVALDAEGALSALALEEVPLVDDEKVQELLSLDAGTELVARILECFNEDAEAMLRQMREVVDSQDYHTMKELAHALRGSAANVGLTRLQLVAEQWEQMGEMEFMSTGQAQVDELERLIQESAHQLSVHFGLEKPRPRLRVVS